MSIRDDVDSTDTRELAEVIPDMRPWREAGWIFRDGSALAIERQGEATRARHATIAALLED